MSKRYAGGIVTAVFKPLDPHGDINYLWAWGQGVDGSLGLNLDGTISRSSPTQIGTSADWLAGYTSAASQRAAAIKQNGTMWVWGNNINGQLGNNTNLYISSPTQIGALTVWSKVNVRKNTSLALKTDGSLWTWGASNFGQLGSNSLTYRSSPVQVGSTPTGQTTNWSRINTGSTSYNFGSIKTDGSLWVWGYNGDGTLGLNSSGAKSSPVQLGTLTDWSSFSSGAVSLAVRTNGTLYGFGYNTQGAVGDNTVIARSSPVQIGSGTTWSVVSAGLDHAVAIKTDGTLWLWGNNNYGQLGTNDRVLRSSPVQVGTGTTWSKISTGAYFTMAIKTDGTMWSWGDNDSGRLGLSDTTHRSSPVQIGSLSTWSKNSAGYNHFLAIKTDGTLWGVGATASIGQNESVIGAFSSPVLIGNDTNWNMISAGSARSSATKTNGTLWTWGNGDSGQNGNNSEASKSSPSQVGAFTNWSYLAEGGYATVGAIKTDGTLWTFGYGNRGSLGDNTSQRRSSPVQVGAQIYGWIDADSGGNWTGAIRADGTLWTWGQTQAGQLGLDSGAPSPIHRSSPVQVGTLTTWSKIKTSGNGMIAIKTDGSLWVWGYQDSGQLGINNTIPRSSPVQVGALTDWSLISSSHYTQHAIKTNGTLWGWGDNQYANLGNNSITIQPSSPVQIGSDTNWSTVSSGMHHTSAIKTTGTLWAWGSNGSGVLGQNDVISRSSPVQIGTNTNWITTASGGSTVGEQFIVAVSNTPF